MIAFGGCATTSPESGSITTVTMSAVPTTIPPSQSPCPTCNQTVTISLATPNVTQTTAAATSLPDQVPIAGFIANKTSGRAPLSVKFVDTSYLSPTNWSWNFGDGNISHEMNPVYTYVTPGTYSVKLIASNEAGSNAVTRIYYITVMPEFQAPVAALGISPQEPLSDTIQFVDQSNGPATNWSWDFGDGGTSVLQNPVHTFPAPGNYIVTLTVSNPLGRSSSTNTSCWVERPGHHRHHHLPATPVIPIQTGEHTATGMGQFFTSRTGDNPFFLQSLRIGCNHISSSRTDPSLFFIRYRRSLNKKQKNQPLFQ